MRDEGWAQTARRAFHFSVLKSFISPTSSSLISHLSSLTASSSLMLINEPHSGHLRRAYGRNHERAFFLFGLVDGLGGKEGHPPAQPDLGDIVDIVVDPRETGPGRPGVEETLGQRVVGHAGHGEKRYGAHERMSAGAVRAAKRPPVRFVRVFRWPPAASQILQGEKRRSAHEQGP